MVPGVRDVENIARRRNEDAVGVIDLIQSCAVRSKDDFCCVPFQRPS